MAPPRNRTGGSLTKALDTKVLSLVRQYLDSTSSSDPVLRLRVSAVYTSIAGDVGIVRQKKATIEKSIEKALEVINAEMEDDDDDDDDDDGIELQEAWGDLDPPTMMVPDAKAVNAVNRRITEMWATASGSASPRGGRNTRGGSPAPVGPLSPRKELPAEVPTPPTTTPASPKRKRKERGEEGRPKRQKAPTNRDPPTNVFLKDLGGIEDAVNQLLEFVAFPLMHPEVYEYTGVPVPRGVLLHGPPGCGKTFLANALAGELGLPFINVSAPSIVAGMSGESEKKVRELFEEAREKAPCLMFLDEIDAITPKRESAQREMERRIVAQFLTCMDDMKPEKNEGRPVVIIGATNRPDSLDPALRRAGRFEKEICLTVPDEEAREKILRVLCAKLRLSGDFDYKALAKKTPGFVGADLSALTAEAGRSAINRIFEALKHSPTIEGVPTEMAPSGGDGNNMDVDVDVDPPPQNLQLTVVTPKPAEPPQPGNLIQNFLAAYPSALTPEQLAPLSISHTDFLSAIPKIQPSSKREGFATVPDVTWDAIGALHSIRQELQMSIVLPIADPALFASVGLDKPIGVLLWGPPGCGKTLLAKAVANESQANFISVKGPELLNKYVGESERAVRQVFARARASRPCVIFFDELDALVPRRDDALTDSSARVVNTLLTELDGLEDRQGVYVVAATNRPDVIDPAMLRPGRLDKPLLVDLPTSEERLDILRTLTKKSPLAADVDLATIAQDTRTDCFSGADLNAIVREATTAALRKAVFEKGSGQMQISKSLDRENMQIHVDASDFEGAFEKVKPSVNKEQRRSYQLLATKFGLKDKK